MKKRLYRFFPVVLSLLLGSVVSASAAEWRDIKADLTSASLVPENAAQWDDVSTGIAVAEDGTLSRVDQTADNCAAVFNGKWHGTQYGWAAFTATVPVQGTVKITLGNSNYGSEVIVTDSEGNIVATVSNKADNTWSTSNSNRVAVAYYRTNAATTLSFSKCDYIGYFAVEAIDPADLPAEVTTARLTFSAGEGAGLLPAAKDYEVGAQVTLPANTTLYAEGKTFSAWSDGTNSYKAGDVLVMGETDVTLTAQFTANTVSLSDRTEEVALIWQLGEKNGAGPINFQGNKGWVVTQATIAGETIDVKVDVDATNGKLNNVGRGDVWAQCNNGTIFTLPSCKGAVVTLSAYNDIAATTIDGQTDYTSGKTVSYTVAGEAETVDVVVADGAYYSSVGVTLPVVQQSAAGTVFSQEKGTLTWPVGNEEAATISDNIAAGISNAAVSIGSGLTVAVKTYTVNSNPMAQYQPATSNAGAKPEVMIEYLVKPATGLTLTVPSVTYDAVKVGTDNATFSYSYVLDGEESDIFTVSKDDILRNNGSNSGTAELGHTITLDKSVTGSFAVRFYISGFANNKQCAIGNVVINSVLDGTVADVTKYTFQAAPNIEEAGTVTVYPAATEYEEGSEITLTATENFGYDFINWTDADANVVSTEAKFTYTINANTVLTANFRQVNTYELALTIDGGAADYMVTWAPEPTIVDGKMMYEEGTVVTLTATGNTLFTFNSWSDGNTFSENKLTMDEDKALTATYSAIDFIAAWDFIRAGSNGRPADFASEDNTAVTLILRNADGDTQSWLDKSKGGDKNGYEGRYAAVNWKNLADKYYFQTKVNAENFSNIQVKSEMLYNYNAYQTQKLEYSLNGEEWNTLTSVTLPKRAWTDVNATLPEEADHASELYLRWIPDYNSNIDGTSGNDGTSIANIYILADADILNDGVPPVLVSTVPADGGERASATGKIVFNFDEKVQLTDEASATLEGQPIALSVSGKTVSAAYKNLDYSANYHFELAAGSVADLGGNVLNEAITISFATMTRPTVNKGVYDFIVPDDGSFETAIARAAARSDVSKRFIIFIKKGEYKLEGSGEELSIERKDSDGNVTKTDHAKNPITTISTPNVSIIGEDMDQTVLWNLPESDEANNRNGEGIGTTATIFLSNAATNTYMQGLTLKNAYPYAQTTGRAVALQDKSDKTICKQVKLLSHQDTYYSNNSSARFYWEDSELHGDVDFLCGGGDVYYNRCNLVIEKRNGNVIAAPNGQKKYGYVFLDCEINPVSDDAYSTVNGTFRLGRPWGADCRAQYINTRMNILPAADGWGEMSNNKPLVFAEYNSTDKNGNAVDLSTRKTTFNGGTQASAVLTEAQVEELSVANVMGGDDDWDPAFITEQAPAVTDAQIVGNTLTWTGNDYALLYAIVKNGSVVGFTTETSYTADDTTAEWAVRAANEMGGLGEAVKAVADATGISTVSSERLSQGAVYDLQGRKMGSQLRKGLYIIGNKKVVK